jgi:hypothetical protein
MRLRDLIPGGGADDTGDEPRQWEVSIGGTTEGPYTEQDLVAAIESGQILKAQVRLKGALGWQTLKSHPPFAQALRRAASTQPMRIPR